MSGQTHLSHGVMEGNGAYNKHAALPAGGATLALPFLEEAVRTLALDLGDRPVVIADYGSSQGKNSLAPVQLAVKNLRLRIGPSRPIVVFHVDQPTNDFNMRMLQRGGSALVGGYTRSHQPLESPVGFVPLSLKPSA
jgi:hypothetical protein